MTKLKIIYNPATIAECGGPCEQGPEYCDCGTLRINCPDASIDDHPLTDEMCEVIATGNQWSGDIGDVVFRHGDMRAAYDLAIDRCIERLSEEAFGVVMARRLRETMRPQEDN